MNFILVRPKPLLMAGLVLLALLVGYYQVMRVQRAAAAANELVAGSYAGAVIVNEPAPLGSLGLFLDITSANNTLSGQVNAIKTQVFLGGPTFTGTVTANGSVTPTLRIESQTFSGVVSGRTVQRHFVLTGEVLDDGDTLRGEYTETIVGFKPQPMLVKGTFLVVRPSGVTAIITVVPPGNSLTPTPTSPTGPPPTHTPTATPTAPTGNPGDEQLFLPLVNRP
jgi:hypothetical protein